MKRKLGFLFVLILLFVVGIFSGNVFAQQDMPAVEVGVTESIEIAPGNILPPRPQPNPILGQDHSYSVVFRGNGEAVVSSKVVFTNREDEAIKTVSLRVPRVEPTEIYAFQVIRERPCIRYETEYDSVLRREVQLYPRVCVEHNEPDYYRYSGAAKYQKADYVYEGDTLTIKLPQEVPSDASGSFLLYYRAFGYAKKNLFGAYDYVFETLKADDQVNKVSVGISTDSDLYLKGAEGEVDYRFEGLQAGEADSIALGAAPQKSIAIDNFASSIGRGEINKSASNLAALESYQVKGSYADSLAKLYGNTILIVVVVLIVLLILLIFGIKLVIKKLNKFTKTKTGGTDVKQADGGSLKMQNQYKPALVSLGISFIVSLLITGYTVFIYLFGNVILSSRLIGYDFQPIILLFLVVMSFIVYCVLLFGPAVYIGAKKSVGWGIATVIMTFFWLMIMFFIALFVLMIVNQVDRYPPIYL